MNKTASNLVLYLHCFCSFNLIFFVVVLFVLVLFFIFKAGLLVVLNSVYCCRKVHVLDILISTGIMPRVTLWISLLHRDVVVDMQYQPSGDGHLSRGKHGTGPNKQLGQLVFKSCYCAPLETESPRVCADKVGPWCLFQRTAVSHQLRKLCLLEY